MSGDTRKRLLDTLTELSPLCPEIRFGQLIENLSTAAIGPKLGSTWDIEDEELLAAAQSLLHALRSRNVAHTASAPG